MATSGAANGTNTAPTGPDKPPGYLVSSIVVAFLCLPFGLIAIFYGLQVQTRWRAGDERGAAHSSDMAEKWMYGGIGAFVLVLIGTAIWWFFVGRHNGEGFDV
jgi:hypothetical protein